MAKVFVRENDCRDFDTIEMAAWDLAMALETSEKRCSTRPTWSWLRTPGESWPGWMPFPYPNSTEPDHI